MEKTTVIGFWTSKHNKPRTQEKKQQCKFYYLLKKDPQKSLPLMYLLVDILKKTGAEQTEKFEKRQFPFFLAKNVTSLAANFQHQ